MSLFASSCLYIVSQVVFVNEIKQWNYDYFACVFLAKFCSPTLGDDLRKVSITAKQQVYYIIEQLKGLIFTLSADRGLPNIFSLNPQETKGLSVRN